MIDSCSCQNRGHRRSAQATSQPTWNCTAKLREQGAILKFIIASILLMAASGPVVAETLVAERLLAQWGGPETRVRCSKWASTTGIRCEGLKCGRTTWRTCVGHATDFLQHKFTARLYAEGGSQAEIEALRKQADQCLASAGGRGSSAAQISQSLSRCLVWNSSSISLFVRVEESTEW